MPRATTIDRPVGAPENLRQEPTSRRYESNEALVKIADRIRRILEPRAES